MSDPRLRHLLPETIEAMNHLSETRRRVAALDRDLRVARDVAARCGVTARLSAWTTWASIIIDFNAKSVQEVIPILRGLRVAGLKRTDGPRMYGEAGLRCVDWGFGSVKVTVTFPTEEQASGEGCRFVKTGVREEPVYDLRCADPEDAKALGVEATA